MQICTFISYTTDASIPFPSPFDFENFSWVFFQIRFNKYSWIAPRYAIIAPRKAPRIAPRNAPGNPRITARIVGRIEEDIPGPGYYWLCSEQLASINSKS